MLSDVEWITTAITKARQQSATVPDVVWTQVEALLRGRFSQRPIPAVELANVAMQLLEGMVPAPPQLEEQQ